MKKILFLVVFLMVGIATTFAGNSNPAGVVENTITPYPFILTFTIGVGIGFSKKLNNKKRLRVLLVAPSIITLMWLLIVGGDWWLLLGSFLVVAGVALVYLFEIMTFVSFFIVIYSTWCMFFVEPFVDHHFNILFTWFTLGLGIVVGGQDQE